MNEDLKATRVGFAFSIEERKSGLVGKKVQGELMGKAT